MVGASQRPTIPADHFWRAALVPPKDGQPTRPPSGLAERLGQEVGQFAQ